MLIKLKNLNNLNLDLRLIIKFKNKRDNKLNEEGAKDIFKAIVKLRNLNNLNLDLR
jgi:hypothetical protein